MNRLLTEEEISLINIYGQLRTVDTIDAITKVIPEVEDPDMVELMYKTVEMLRNELK